MRRWNPVLLLVVMLALLVGVVTWALALDGTPMYCTTYCNGSLAVSTLAVSLPTGACKGTAGTGLERRALLQIQSNGIYYVLNSATATPVATDFVGNVGDVLEVERPSTFRAIRQSADATVAWQCFER